jgi:hypothetical protein
MIKKYLKRFIIRIIEEYLCPNNYLSFKSWVEATEKFTEKFKKECKASNSFSVSTQTKEQRNM